MPPATEFRAALAALNLKQRYAAGLFGTSVRNLRRWRNGQRPIPFGIAILVRLLNAGAVSAGQVEQAAARTIRYTGYTFAEAGIRTPSCAQ
jgi:hypothetical protein